jgi:hypothetical protein
VLPHLIGRMCCSCWGLWVLPQQQFLRGCWHWMPATHWPWGVAAATAEAWPTPTLQDSLAWLLLPATGGHRTAWQQQLTLPTPFLPPHQPCTEPHSSTTTSSSSSFCKPPCPPGKPPEWALPVLASSPCMISQLRPCGC